MSVCLLLLIPEYQRENSQTVTYLKKKEKKFKWAERGLFSLNYNANFVLTCIHVVISIYIATL